MRNLFYLLLIMMIPSLGFSQRWKTDRQGIYFGLGMSNFMGDLGGGAKNAAHFLGVRDIDLITTRPSVQFGYRYRVIEELAVKGGISYALVAANDISSSSEGRKLRNLSFKSDIWELYGQAEYFFVPEKDNPRYSFSSLRSIRNLSAYVFMGLGVFYYNPKALYNGRWYELQPLATEGQGLGLSYTYTRKVNGLEVLEQATTPKKYKHVAVSLPIGLGAKYNINSKWSIGLEISNRFTSTDYLDDAHNRYFNYKEQKDKGAITDYNPLSAVFADRHLNSDGTPAPSYDSGKTMRGNPNYNDSYILTVFTAYYKLKPKGRGLPKY